MLIYSYSSSNNYFEFFEYSPQKWPVSRLKNTQKSSCPPPPPFPRPITKFIAASSHKFEFLDVTTMEELLFRNRFRIFLVFTVSMVRYVNVNRSQVIGLASVYKADLNDATMVNLVYNLLFLCDLITCSIVNQV